jgi:CSLREA domain-containing protein
MSTRQHSRKTARQNSVSRNHKQNSLYRRTLRCERLEDRCLLAVVTVTTLADTIDVNDGVTSLREAIFATNIVPGADTINFAPALTAGGAAKILLTDGELAINDTLTINGPGASLLTIDAQQLSRIFNITATTSDYSVSGLTLKNGKTTGAGQGFAGGAIRSATAGSLTVNSCIVDSCNTTGANGGGIFSVGALMLGDTLISNNKTGGLGGGILGQNGITLNNSTVSGNNSVGVFAYGDVSLTFTTISANAGQGVFSWSGRVDMVGGTVRDNHDVESLDRP